MNCAICGKEIGSSYQTTLQDGRVVCSSECWKTCNCIRCQDDYVIIGIDQTYCKEGVKLDKPVGEKEPELENICKNCIYWQAVRSSTTETANCSKLNELLNKDHSCLYFTQVDRMESQADLSDPVSHPSHFTGMIIKGVEIECIDVIEGLGLGYHLGNALKYIWRAGRKTDDPQEDLKKAVWYVKRSLEQ